MSDAPAPTVPASSESTKPARTPPSRAELRQLHRAMADVQRGLRRRAVLLQLIAWIAFIATLGLLGGGGWFLWNADRFALETSREQADAIKTQRDAADAQDRLAKERATAFQNARNALADKLANEWPPRRVGQSLYGSAMLPDGRRGWAVGVGGTILRTENGGASWQAQTSGVTQRTGNSSFFLVGDAIRSIWISPDASRGWAVGDGGLILLLTFPDVSAIRADATTAAQAEQAVQALNPPQGIPAPAIAELKRLELEREEAERQGRNLRVSERFVAAQTGPRGGADKDGWNLLNPVTFNAFLLRIMTMLIIFFAISILLTVFRYALRMASQYDGRADALRLTVGELDERFHKLVETMVPNGIDFGKLPRSPASMAFELAKEMVRDIKPKS